MFIPKELPKPYVRDLVDYDVEIDEEERTMTFRKSGGKRVLFRDVIYQQENVERALDRALARVSSEGFVDVVLHDDEDVLARLLSAEPQVA